MTNNDTAAGVLSRARSTSRSWHDPGKIVADLPVALPRCPFHPAADSSACREDVTSPPPPIPTRSERNSAATDHRQPGSG